MEKNHICKKCGGIAGWDSYYQSWICTRCGDVERKPITNADRIRSMTDEELAEFLETLCPSYNWTLALNGMTWFGFLKQEVSANDS